jgi:hypothetical protein
MAGAIKAIMDRPIAGTIAAKVLEARISQGLWDDLNLYSGCASRAI